MTFEYRSPLNPNRVYSRKFDHDEARRLLADGMTLQAVADRMGVSQPRVWQISSPEAKAATDARSKEWHKALCDDCGRECTHNWSSKHGRHDRVVCRQCDMRRRSEDHLLDRLNDDGDVLCNGCGQYLPHEEYRLTKTTQVPTSRCRNCETTRRRDYRKTHLDQDRAYQRERRRRTPYVSRRTKTSCSGCGCPLDDSTPGCTNCYGRHYMRTRRQRRTKP